tara:strand:+ start:120 stop:422 length:303 start_codon:yes stop_codon:yes gene_type:complete
MTSTFPLYNSIKNITDFSKELQPKDLLTVSHKIKKLDKSTHELIYALIKSYQIDNKQNKAHMLPYESKQLKTGVKFDMNNIPKELQCMLSKFLEMHEKSN